MPAEPVVGVTALDAIRLDEHGPIPCLRIPLLEGVPGVRHAFTTRHGGRSTGPYVSTNLGLAVGDDRDAVLANRALATHLVCEAGGQPVTARQVHGVTALRVTERGDPGVPLADGDMLTTDVPGVPLMVQSADCVPLVVVDRTRNAVAVVHAGWRGTAAFAGREAVASMVRFFGSAPADLVIGIGPAIGACCYEVSDEVAGAVATTAPGTTEQVVVRKGQERPHIDLVAALAAQLRQAGVPQQQIAIAGLCTGCRTDLFYSHRREGEPTGRFGALVCLSPSS